jgi:DNA (cytosine-5)-methyltransferase 1
MDLMIITIGSLCTGYGGLDLAVTALTGGRVTWHSELDRHAAVVAAAHHPDAPNLGDLTRTDWAAVDPVDLLTAGYPCQPFSQAGHRKGVHDDRHLWPHIARAISVVRPRAVVLENVRGHITLGFTDVLSDLAAMGFDIRWGCVRASDAGAPHQRERIFVVATDPARELIDWRSAEGQSGNRAAGRLLATPTTSDAKGSALPPSLWAHRGNPEDSVPRAVAALLPTPTVVDLGRGRTVEEWDRWCDKMRGRHGNGNGHGPSLTIEMQRKLTDKYGPALARWGHILGRPAPAPVVVGSSGRPALAPRFVEWMMGLPDGWVTEQPLSRRQQVKILGNGVVPQQAMLALGLLVDDRKARRDR